MRYAYCFFLALGLSTSSPASDVYVVQGSAIGPQRNACDWYNWIGDVLFHNATSAPQTITLLGISNGDLPVGTDRTLTIPAGRTMSAFIQRNWSPLPTTVNPLWVDHLDVPNGVVLESRMEIGISTGCGPGQFGPLNGKLSFPVFRELQPAGVTAIHLGTDLGMVDARNNVGVFNAGSATANVHIELHQGCDDQTLSTVDVTVPPNTTRQFGIRDIATACPATGGGTKGWVTYVTVTSDQPGISFVSSIANAKDIVVPYAVSSSSAQ